MIGLGAAEVTLKLKQTAGKRTSEPAGPVCARKQPCWRVSWDEQDFSRAHKAGPWRFFQASGPGNEITRVRKKLERLLGARAA
jgi:hypothetical protein